ncbi:MAG: acyl carrier protein [Acidobacteriota bacterium]
MSSEATLKALVATIAEIPAAEVDLDEDLLTGGLIDSIGIVRLIADAEAELSVKVPDPDLVPENFRTLRVMTIYFDGLVAAN